MRSPDILYQLFQARYSLEKFKSLIDQPLSVALIGRPEQIELLEAVLGPSWQQESFSFRKQDLMVHRLVVEEDVDGLVFPQDADLYLILVEQQPGEEWTRAIAKAIPLDKMAFWFTLDASQSPAGEVPGIQPDYIEVTYENMTKVIINYIIRAVPGVATRLACHFGNVREIYLKKLTQDTAFSNARIAVASTVPVELVPVVGGLLKFLAVTGETLVITASQLRICLITAALYGRSLDFFDRVNELLPIIGGGFGWRFMVKRFMSWLPAIGWLTKGSFAYIGTYAVGEVSRLYFENGVPDESEVRQSLLVQSRKRAEEAFQDLQNDKDAGFDIRQGRLLEYIDQLTETEQD